MWSWRAGGVFQPTAAQMYYAYYGTSFNPSAEYLTLTAATADLDPEENETFEIGARWDLLNAALTLQGAIFRTEKTNGRTVDPANATVTVLDGKARVDGVELGVVGRVTPSWQVFAGVVYQNGEILNGSEAVGGVPVSRAGNTLQSTPPWSGSLWTTYTWPSGWELGGGVFFVDDAYANNANTIRVDGYTRFDMTAAYIPPKWDVRLNLYNLTDEAYIDNYYAGHAVPGRARWGSVTFTYRF
jgi:catecholate siderophore receptor